MKLFKDTWDVPSKAGMRVQTGHGTHIRPALLLLLVRRGSIRRIGAPSSELGLSLLEIDQPQPRRSDDSPMSKCRLGDVSRTPHPHRYPHRISRRLTSQLGNGCNHWTFPHITKLRCSNDGNLHHNWASLIAVAEGFLMLTPRDCHDEIQSSRSQLGRKKHCNNAECSTISLQ